ncbi:MAG: hypothetical protein ACYTEW_17065, partial [Planctomycetota bacterium]
MKTILSWFIASTLGSAAILAVILLILGAARGIPINQGLHSIFAIWWFYLGFGVLVTVVRMFKQDFWTTTRMGSPAAVSHKKISKSQLTKIVKHLVENGDLN